MRLRTTLSRPLAATTLLLGSTFAPSLSAQGQKLLDYEGFYSPSGAVFAADGRTLYIGNSARGDYGMLEGEGVISRCLIGADGTFSMVKARFTTGLNAPLGMAVLPVATGVSPAGAIVVAVGGTWTTDRRGRALEDDRARGTGLVLIDPESGAITARVFLGEGSPVTDAIGHPLMDPFSVAADPAGNLYVVDYAARGTRIEDDGRGLPGILKLTPAALEALAGDAAAPQGSVAFTPVRNVPTGIAYSTSDDALVWATGNDAFDLGGGILRLPGGDFSGGARLETVAKNLTSINSIAILDGGTILAARNSGDIVSVPGRRARVVTFRDRTTIFLSPGQIAATRLADGGHYVVVPETSGGGRRPWQHRVRTFTLPRRL